MKFKSTICIIFVILLTLSLGIGASALDPSGTDDVIETVADEEEFHDDSASGDYDLPEVDTDVSSGTEDSDIGDTGAGKDVSNEEKKFEEKNGFALVFEALREHMAEIFSFLTFIGSLLIAFTYKRGLLPIMRGGIGALSDTVEKIEKSTTEQQSVTEKIRAELMHGAEKANEQLDALDARLERLCRDIVAIKQESLTGATVCSVLNEEVELLYDVFMSSSLPQYQKDEVSKKVAVMKKELKKNEADIENKDCAD